MDKLLIVDKSEQIVDLIGKLLSAENYDTYTASTGKTALAKLKIIKPDLIIMDADLPDMSGFDVCKIIKSNSETKYILVLILISVESKDYILRSVYAGSDDYIPKLFESTVFLAKIKSLLRVKHLSDRLSTQYLELKEKNELIDFQLKMAMQVQRSIIREINTNINNVHILSRYLPALDIGGDYFNLVKLSKDKIGVIMCDVSGHGISAALLTSMLSIMFNSAAKKHTLPNKLIMEMNNSFCGVFENSNSQMYACIFYAIIDMNNKIITYSNAGESYPIYVDNTTKTAVELELDGMPIGFIKNVEYKYKTLSYNNNDLLFIHTDGLSDVYYKDSPEEFIKKLKQALLVPQDSLNDTIEFILEQFYNLQDSKKYENDDVSMILCKL